MYLTCQTPAADPLSSRYEAVEWRNAAKLRRWMWWRLWAKRPTGEYWSLAAALDLPFPTPKLSDTSLFKYSNYNTMKSQSMVELLHFYTTSSHIAAWTCAICTLHSCFLTFELKAKFDSWVESIKWNRRIVSCTNWTVSVCAFIESSLNRVSVERDSFFFFLQSMVLTHVNEIDIVLKVSSNVCI